MDRVEKYSMKEFERLYDIVMFDIKRRSFDKNSKLLKYLFETFFRKGQLTELELIQLGWVKQ